MTSYDYSYQPSEYFRRLEKNTDAQCKEKVLEEFVLMDIAETVSSDAVLITKQKAEERSWNFVLISGLERSGAIIAV